MQEVTIAPGQTLWDALAYHGIQLTRPCGGRGICGGCKVYVDGLGAVLACRFDTPGTYRVSTSEPAGYHAVMNQGGQGRYDAMRQSEPESNDAVRQSELERDDVMRQSESGSDDALRQSDLAGKPQEDNHPHSVFIAVDIGTTTVALSGICRERTAQEGFLNPQRSFGADVISRIAAANAGQGDELCAMLMEPLMEALERMRARLNRDCTHCIVGIAANTTMLHILRGFSCEGLGQAPFAPVDLSSGHDVWRGVRAEFDIYYMPGISAYVGADIVSGIYGLDMKERQEVTMLLDLGTNGEMAIGNCNRLLCASAAAGPAFEGSPLALQIHASGILKCLHKLRKCGMIDEYGLLDEEYFEQGYPVEQLMEAETDETADEQCPAIRKLRITQEDIREIQMAKSAIRAGIELLLKEYGVDARDVSKVYLAGGMGYYIDPMDAVGIGLLPAAFADKTEAVGNSCLMGLLRAYGAMGDEAYMQGGAPRTAQASDTEANLQWREVLTAWKDIADSAEEIVLAEHPDFAELYIEEMNFE